MKALQTSIVTSRGGRQGHVRSSDGILDLDVAPPVERGGPGGATNPEQLFAAAYAACFEGAFRLAAKNQDIALAEASITVHVTLNVSEDKTFDLSAEIHGKAEGLSQDQLMALMKSAHEICPYSRATRGNIQVELFPEA